MPYEWIRTWPFLHTFQAVCFPIFAPAKRLAVIQHCFNVSACLFLLSLVGHLETAIWWGFFCELVVEKRGNCSFYKKRKKERKSDVPGIYSIVFSLNNAVIFFLQFCKDFLYAHPMNAKALFCKDRRLLKLSKLQRFQK